ncbi:hypothetical protein GCM10022225_73470 [Plantactinospora mayteni]|uniref:MftR C-terminal domain-containing protein n=1 Tax=Plantactinospora mayteni TaxID=566021 RepID=A0ABQ4F1L2_9ACTN|nr:hypothetical protein [Plantactinospora mayteni]GIH00802.1 hypothetical protein Pma05_73740 [Plantactinospora mayteni]
MDETSTILEADRDRQLVRIRLLVTTPSLAGSYLAVLTDFERLLRAFVAERTDERPDSPQARLMAAATTTAFRVATEIWLDSDGALSLAALAQDNLSQLLDGRPRSADVD